MNRHQLLLGLEGSHRAKDLAGAEVYQKSEAGQKLVKGPMEVSQQVGDARLNVRHLVQRFLLHLRGALGHVITTVTLDYADRRRM